LPTWKINVLARFQSGFRLCHSTETAVVRIANDIFLLSLLMKKYGKITALVRLDLSAACNTVDMNFFYLVFKLILSQLLLYYGLGLSSLVAPRLFPVHAHFIVSSVTCGVPQGSVLEPLLFCIYTQPLEKLIQRHNLAFISMRTMWRPTGISSRASFFCIYTQPLEKIIQRHNLAFISMGTIPNCTSIDPPEAQDAVAKLDHCLSDIRDWMAANFPKQKNNTIEHVLFGHLKRSAKTRNFELPVGINNVKPSPCARNLLVHFDRSLYFKQFVQKTAAMVTFHIRSLVAIRDHILKN